MHFADEAAFQVISGKGGDGCVSFRREKYIPKGGPDGGDGGKGGDVIFKLNPHLNTLYNLRSKKTYKAQNGFPGEGNDKHGKNGQDLIIEVPAGTLIYNSESEELLADISPEHPTWVAVFGGRGGYGNAHFTSSVRKAPDFGELGDWAQAKDLRLELKLVADVGIVGLPSRGKSTLISVISNAKPKIAEYEFTTLVPNLGVVHHKGENMVVSDVPGLIEGASEGKGLGHEFLRHVERCSVLLHLLDAGRLDKLTEDYKVIMEELKAYAPGLLEKPMVIAVNKTDLLDKELQEEVEALLRPSIGESPLFFISAAAHMGLETLLDHLLHEVRAHQEEELKHTETVETTPTETITIRPLEEMDEWTFYQDEDGKFHVKGSRIEQIARMTDRSKIGALERLMDVLQKKGMAKRLEKAGLEDGDKFFIGELEFEYMEEIG